MGSREDVTMNQQNAFDRIAELEAKLKIATENCAQAVVNCGQMVKEVEASRMALVLVRERLVEPLERRLQAAEAVCSTVVSD